MTDSIDDALNRSRNREVLIGAGVKYLGKDRRRDAELLADLMTEAITTIVASATVRIAPSADFPDEMVKATADRLRQHTEVMAHTAVRAMTHVFTQTLRAADRALRNEPPDGSRAN